MKLVPKHLGFCLLLAVLAACIGSTATAQSAQTDVYFADQIWQGNGETIQDGAMVVVDGIITAIGPRKDQKIPSTAKRHDLGSQVLIPGLVIAQSVLGGNQTEERTITPQIRALDGFDFYADRASLLESGLTTIQVSPARNRLMPGVGGVVKLAGDELMGRILLEQESLQIVLTSASRQPPRIYEPSVGPVSEDRPLNATRPQIATLSASMATLRQILKAATAEAESADGDEVIEAVAAIVKAKTPLRISASTAPEIRGAISLAKEFGVKIILTDCVGLGAFEEILGDWKKYVAGVVLTAAAPGQISNPTIEQIEAKKQPWDFARELLDAGIPVAIAPSADSQLTASMFVAGQFMRDGMTRSELLTALTQTPAEIMNVGDQVGSLEKGKQADFVVLSGQPFDMHSRVSATYVGGKSLVERRVAAKTTTTIVSADRIYVGNGKYLDGGQVLVKGKTIRSIGSDVSSPADATARKFKGAVIVPGFVDMGTSLGLGGPVAGAVQLSTKLSEQLYSDDPAIQYARTQGITTALLVPAGASGKPAPVVAFKLGDDVRVIGDPVALKFTLTGGTSTAIAAAEAQLVAGKKYVDSWKKYDKDLAEYNEKKKAEAAKPKAKAEPKKEVVEKKADSKKPDDKKDGDKKDAEKDKPKPDDKKDPEKEKEGEKDKEKDEKKKKKALPDPISGTWEGEIDMERIPPQMRAFTFEMVLEQDGTVTGNVKLLGQSVDIASGTYDRESRALVITIERRGQELEISGELDAEGAFEGSMEFGRAGEVALTATRTVDKSKKPEPEGDEKDKPEKKDPEKDKDKKDKPESGDDKDKKEKPKEKEADSKDADSKDADKKDDKAAEQKKEEKKSALKEPKKPKLNAAMEPYKALFAGEIPAMVETGDLSTIKEAAKLFAEKYKLRTAIVGADSLAREPAALAGYSVSVIAGPRFSVSVPKQIDDTNMPQLLANEQLPFAFRSSGTTGSGQLPSVIQFSVSQGLSTIDALDGLTSSAANMLSEKSTFGSIRAGHDADLVVLSGPPFEFSTKVLAVMIDGVWVYERKEEK